MTEAFKTVTDPGFNHTLFPAGTLTGTIQPVTIAPIHGSIVRALCKVQASIEAVTKSEFNKHGQYKFASTDDIYAALTRKLGEAGLMIYPLELEPVQEIKDTVGVYDRDGQKTGEKTVTKLRFRYGYVLATEEATWFDPKSARTLILLHTGPQTFNAAESFCQKAYLRALLKLPTGDQDLDGLPQADTDDDQAALQSIGRVKRKSSAEGKRDGSVKRFNELRAKITSATGAIECREVWTANANELAVMPRGWFETLSEDYMVQMKSFGIEVEPEDQQALVAAE